MKAGVPGELSHSRHGQNQFPSKRLDENQENIRRGALHGLDNIQDGLVHSLGRGKRFYCSFFLGLGLNFRFEFLQSF